ncbi:hypothetical protein O3P69_006962 [Scylla paramamosain]|uniref:Uncharacterized protein n=1 Tax=Scylla paramamosain TaxID=85552 RepID=A0AAW0V366_SCYPA
MACSLPGKELLSLPVARGGRSADASVNTSAGRCGGDGRQGGIATDSASPSSVDSPGTVTQRTAACCSVSRGSPS